MNTQTKVERENKVYGMASMFTRGLRYWREHNIGAWIMFFLLIYIVAIVKLNILRSFYQGDILFTGYSILVSLYIISRFALAYFYSPKPTQFQEENDLFEPTVSFAVPSKNEQDNIYETIMRMASSEYPRDKFDIIAINDGSTDDTLAEMNRAKKDARELGISVKVVDWEKNRGKRDGMAECVRLSNKEIIFFVDSDSFVASDALPKIVQYFKYPKIGAVAGHAYVANANANMLTKMQSVRYYVAFKAYKAAEALFGTVTCCSGCCSAYRKSSLMPFLEAWEKQSFLGVRCTYGDDRSLTNYMIYYGHESVFAPDVIAYTFVPDTFKQFMRQQLRWKKSWFRENLIASIFMWRKNIIMSLSFYIGFLLPLMAPIIVARVVFWYPLATGHLPWFYIFGLLLMSSIYGLYYYIYTNDKNWVYGVSFATFYTLVLVWQLPYAIMNLRDSSWGTR